jgi:hypothetical protein
MLAFGVPGARSDGVLPQYASDRHLGVRECSSTLCHNSVTPWQPSRVRLNEYRIWRDRDRHTQAFTALRGTLGQRIGRNLAIADVTTAAECLDCHADDVPAAARGEAFDLTDGVGCESCHGGAERWLESHRKGSRRDDEARGMFPTWDPRARAALCLSCHQGVGKKIVTHRMLAAGHPRLAFELDSFDELQPPHWAPLARAGESHVRTWAVGQAVALREYLGLLAEPRRSTAGWQEFAFLDCATCHHDLGVRARPKSRYGTPLGLPRLTEAQFSVYEKVLALVAPADVAAVDGQVRALDRSMATRSADLPARAVALGERVAGTVDRVAVVELDDGQALRALAECDRPPTETSYLVAEQLTLGIQAVLADRKVERVLTGSRDEVQPLLDATQSLADFDPARFRQALRAVCRDGR